MLITKDSMEKSSGHYPKQAINVNITNKQTIQHHVPLGSSERPTYYSRVPAKNT
jgi:hypothetical protein